MVSKVTTEPPVRGEVWDAELSPTRGREQSGFRPVLVISSNRLNDSPAELVVVLPLTTRIRGIPMHVLISPPEAGLQRESVILCEQVRAVSRERLLRRRGLVAHSTLSQVEDRLRILLDIP